MPYTNAQIQDNPEISILMINNSINWDFDESGNGEKLITNGDSWIHLAEIPSSFGSNSEEYWNISSANYFSGQSISNDGTKIVVEDDSGASPLQFYV